MFPKRQRIAKTAFTAAIRGAKRLSAPHFSILVPPGGSGYAVIVSKKTAKRSVDRHRLKRRVLAALRTLPAFPPALILYPKASVITLPFADLKAELADALSKAPR